MTDWHLLADEQPFRAVVLDDDRPVVVAFEPDPCRACRDQRTLLSLLWRQLDSVGAGRVLTDRTPQMGERYGIAAYPTLAVFWRGELVDRLHGPRHPDGVNRRLAALLHPPRGRPRRCRTCPRPRNTRDPDPARRADVVASRPGATRSQRHRPEADRQ